MRSTRTLIAIIAGLGLLGTGAAASLATAAQQGPAEGAAAQQGRAEGAASATAAQGGSAEPEPVTVHNPISDSFSDTYADPMVIRGKDGYWYMYATSDPLTQAPSEFGLMHIARTADFSEWEYLGEVFDSDTRPTWATESSLLWAPDVRYVGGEYVLYYTATDVEGEHGEWNYAIGAATAPTPAGPWTDSGAAVVEPRPDGDGGFFNTIDPALFTDDDGTRYLYFGGYHGGLWVTELDETGVHAVGEPVQVSVADRYEGAFVVKRDGYYYLTASSANCCAGPVTGYSVYAGRSTSPWGPFVDHEGVSMLSPRVGGTQVLVQNGNSIVGVGHHAIFADTTGQDWIVYHGIERDDPWLDDPGGINQRPAFLDRLDWIDGWPVAAAGAGPTEGALVGPTTGSALGIVMDDPAASQTLRTMSGSWQSVNEELNDAGAVGLLDPGDGVARVQTVRPGARQVRVEADVRFPDAAGTFTVDLARIGLNGVSVDIDLEAGQLRTEVVSPSGTSTETSPLPATFDPQAFTAVVIELGEDGVHAQLTESRLGDPLAEVSAQVPRSVPTRRPLALQAADGPVQVANLSVAQLDEPVTEAVAEPGAGQIVFAEEFDGELAPGWDWVRPDEAISVADGALHWPLTSTDVVGPDNTGTLLLREPPPGEWIVQTELTLDVGEDEVRNYQQAGLIVHVDDDDLVRFGSVALHATRQVEFGKELSDGDRLDWGAHLSGPTATTMWLRLHHSVDEHTGDLLYRSASSVDGQNWRWGATWTLPADANPRVGLYAGGGAEPATTAVFTSLTFHTVDE